MAQLSGLGPELEALALRLPVQAIYKFDDRRIVAGRIESGSLAAGDEIVIMPAGKIARIKSVEGWPATPVKGSQTAGRSVGITLDYAPVLDVHTGFPFSQLDENWNFVGQRNGAGRFPAFVGLDVKLQYPFDFKFHGRRFEFRAGLNVPNVLNYFNPRDVQEYAKSPNYGHFYNSIGRLWRIEGAFDF